jgi:hypothetical protein
MVSCGGTGCGKGRVGNEVMRRGEGWCRVGARWCEVLGGVR